MDTLSTSETQSDDRSSKLARGLARIRRIVEERQLRSLDLLFTEPGGATLRFPVDAQSVLRGELATGAAMDGHAHGGFWSGTALLVPELDAVYTLPSLEGPAVAVCCDVVDPQTAEPLPASPRGVLAHAEALARRHTAAPLGATAEPELALIDPDGEPARPAVVDAFLGELFVWLSTAGVASADHRCEPGGRARLTLRSPSVLQLGDFIVVYRLVAGELLRSRGIELGVAADPRATSSMPLSFNNDSPAFRAGVQRRLPALLALSRPTVTAYRFPPETACESAANPYLALAAGTLAGVEGVVDKLEGPVDPPPLPQSLEEALAKLDAQRRFLTRGGAFNDHIIDAWLENRWNQQVLPARKNRIVKRPA